MCERVRRKRAVATAAAADIYIYIYIYERARVVIGISDCTGDLIISGFRDYHLGRYYAVITRRRVRARVSSLTARLNLHGRHRGEPRACRLDARITNFYTIQRSCATRCNFRRFSTGTYMRPFPLRDISSYLDLPFFARGRIVYFVLLVLWAWACVSRLRVLFQFYSIILAIHLAASEDQRGLR